MRIARAVVDERAALERVLHRREIDVPDAVRIRRRGVGRELERVEGDARVSVRDHDQRAQRIRGHRDLAIQPPRVGERALDDEPHVILL